MTPLNVLHQMYSAPYLIADPGDAETINVNQQFAVVPVVTATSETRILAQPTKAGIFAAIVLDKDGGDLTLTVNPTSGTAYGYNADNATTIVFDDAGDFVVFFSVKIGTEYAWRVIAQEGTNAASEDLSVDQLTVATLTLGATALTATGAEINDALDVSAQDKMAPSTVIDATVEQYVSSVRRVGNLIKTEILIDLTGAKSVATDKDIIGDTGACHFGQITTAINGAIVCGQMTCLEVPIGGADDIDLYMASVGTGAYDADGSGLANAVSLITKGGAWALSAPGAATAFSAPVTANYYLYLLSGEAAAGTYTAGKFLIELWGLPS